MLAGQSWLLGASTGSHFPFNLVWENSLLVYKCFKNYGLYVLPSHFQLFFREELGLNDVTHDDQNLKKIPTLSFCPGSDKDRAHLQREKMIKKVPS